MRFSPALVTSVLLSPVLASAQQRPMSQPLLIVGGQPIDGATTASPDTLLKSKLRGLVIAQEKFWAEHGTYTTDVSQLGLFPASPSSADSVWVQVLFAGGRSWSGRALYRRKPPKSCVIYIGFPSDFPSPAVTEADSVRARTEGAPACDRF